ncbi:hypothetical protein PUR28_27845 [Streptomyces sp. BE308]|uniref:hypothetical protein n=1 Tax=Streptomyces sp. BE308 TaxID=3002529 RepID=UPI002E7A52DA|nr:hypothetical protein [Streptomyces sp. BE308]MEE1794542.1 hypothetical protein [Streptomyces sp. BE308]
MAYQDPGPRPSAHIDFAALKEEWSRERARASEQLDYFDTLLKSAQDIEDVRELWQELATGPVRHPLFLPAQTPAAAPPPGAVVELTVEQVLQLMRQQAPRLWRTTDIATAFSHPSPTQVRQFLQTMVRSGHLEEVRRKARHLLFRLPTTPPQ